MNIRKINSLEYCIECNNLCKDSCLSYNITKNRYFTPKNRAINILNYLKRNQDIDYELLYSCLHCSRCSMACPHGNNISEVTLFAKEDCIISERTDNYIDNFEENFYHNDDSIYSIDLKELSGKYNFQKYINNTDTIFISGSDTLFYNPQKIDDIYKVFNNLNLNPSLYLFKSDSWLELYYLGYKDEVITDIKEWLRSIKDVTTIITSSLKLIEILNVLKPLINVKVPNVIDIFTYLLNNGYSVKRMDSFIFINNTINRSFNYNILKEICNNITFIEQIKYSISDSMFKIFYTQDRLIIKEYIKKNMKNIDFIVVPDEETKLLFLKYKPKKMESKVITLIDLIT